MAGRIRQEDIAIVRERSPIDAVIGEYLQLVGAGGGNAKGLCPFHDEKTPSFNVTPSRGLYFCLEGSTRVLTWEGVKPIRELAGGTHRILGRDANWYDAPFHSFGEQPLMRIVLGRNGQTKEIFATPEHRWFVRSGQSRRTEREVVTSDLKPEHRLASVFPRSRVARTKPSPFGIAHGITFGDGTRTASGSRATLDSVKDAQLLKWFPLSLVTENVGPSDRAQLLVHGLPNFFKDLPDPDEAVHYLYGWLAGYFAADGTVAADGTIALHCADREVLEFVRLVCTRLGIGTYGITGHDREGFPGREPSTIYRVHLLGEDLCEDFFLLDHHRFRWDSSRKKSSRLGWVVKSVETTDRFEEVFCAVVEEGHAFVLEDNILTGNCHGCGVGGDVIKFVQEIEHLSFAESVERLAAKAGVQLQYEEGGYVPRKDLGQRARLVDAHKEAAAFYAQQLTSQEASIARKFLTERGFQAADAAHFGIGYAPNEWEALVGHLRSRGFTDVEILKGGLAVEGRRGPRDRFRGRLIWPIRDQTGDVIGFGARKLHDSDDGPKYLNTPETPLYHKSSVLYGLDLAKKDIAKLRKAVIVEGYTDVMACHLAGETTAIATCGTAFGDDHIKILRRMLMDQAEARGEVIFTFDGDSAGQKAALRAFEDDHKFATQTFVAVQPDGLDPCDLRIKQGDAAIRDLVASRVPLFEFAIKNRIEKFDSATVEGQMAALDAVAPIIAGIRDAGMRKRYAVNLDRWLGLMDEELVLSRVQQHMSGGQKPRRRPPADPNDPTVELERELLKIALQRPVALGPLYDQFPAEAYTVPEHRAVHEVILSIGGCASATAPLEWASRLRDAAPGEEVRTVLTRLSVESPKSQGNSDDPYAQALLVRFMELQLTREIATAQAKLGRLNPVSEADEYNRLFGDLVALEQRRRHLRDRGVEGL
ncbi:DNA primase [Actinocorallia longicatena]|uniref:DNA primase n=1 Tax=Actinocorallia longicatena TaxID=111803 RepID=A0ABP6QK75_9ACTN